MVEVGRTMEVDAGVSGIAEVGLWMGLCPSLDAMGFLEIEYRPGSVPAEYVAWTARVGVAGAGGISRLSDKPLWRRERNPVAGIEEFGPLLRLSSARLPRRG